MFSEAQREQIRQRLERLSEVDAKNGLGERKERQRQFYASLFGQREVKSSAQSAETGSRDVTSQEPVLESTQTQVNESNLNMSCSMIEPKTELKHFREKRKRGHLRSKTCGYRLIFARFSKV